LVPLEGEEIGRLVVQAVINSSMPEEFDTVVVKGADKWAVAAE
jgi:hypothetical protein